MCVVQLLFKLLSRVSLLNLAFEVLLFQIVVVELVAHELVVVNPCGNHVLILFIEMHAGGLAVERDRLVVADLIRGQGSGSIQQHFTPEVGVSTRFVHSSIRLEVLLDVQLIFLKKSVNLLIIGRVDHLVEIATHSVLLIVESVNVRTTNCEHVLSQQLAEHTPINSI